MKPSLNRQVLIKTVVHYIADTNIPIRKKETKQNERKEKKEQQQKSHRLFMLNDFALNFFLSMNES